MNIARIVPVLLLGIGSPVMAQTAPDPGCTSEPSAVEPLFLGVSAMTVPLTCPQPQGGTVTIRAQVIRVNLGAPGLKFEVSQPPGTAAVLGVPAQFDQELTTSFLQRTKSQVAFNANLFTNCCCDYVPTGQTMNTYLIGLAVSDRRILSRIEGRPTPLPGSCGSTPAGPYPFDHSLLVSGNSLRIQGFADVQPAPQVDAAVTGSHLLVSGGQNVAPPAGSDEFFGPNARTVVGLSGDNKVLWIAALDRWRSQGATLQQAAQLMIQLGALTAINFDGGGSTSLVVEDRSGAPRLLNLPNDTPDPNNPYKKQCIVAVDGHCERFVGASFGIHALPLPPTAR